MTFGVQIFDIFPFLTRQYYNLPYPIPILLYLMPPIPVSIFCRRVLVSKDITIITPVVVRCSIVNMTPPSNNRTYLIARPTWSSLNPRPPQAGIKLRSFLTCYRMQVYIGISKCLLKLAVASSRAAKCKIHHDLLFWLSLRRPTAPRWGPTMKMNARMAEPLSFMRGKKSGLW